MKRYLALILFFGSSLTWASPDPADYTATIHVVSSQIELDLWGETVVTNQTLNVLIDGKKYKLACSPIRMSKGQGVIVPGDYKGKVVSEQHRGAYAYAAQYELLFPDQTTTKLRVIGETE